MIDDSDDIWSRLISELLRPNSMARGLLYNKGALE